MATVYRDMTQEKKDIVEEMGFGALAHVPEMNGRIYITPRKVAAAVGITNGGNRFDDKVDYNKLNPDDKKIFDNVKNIFLETLTRNVLDMRVEGEKNRKKFKRTFVIFIQKCFLLPTTVSVASPIHKPPIFHVDNIHEWDWAKHVLNFLMKGVENKRKGRKQSVDGYVFVLILIYFHETKFPRPFAPNAPPAPWVAHWTKQMMLEQISRKATEPLKIVNLNSSSGDERFSESESQFESDKTPPAKRARQKKVLKKQKLVEKNSQSTSETESIPTDSKSKKKKKSKKPEQRKENNYRRTEQAKDNAAERRGQALETIREKR
ncbi:hypothetical protein Ahy_A03g012311 isoform B [Arachis hypogaea]|uniref:Uncharacterized protein n=1 Tax=Arachis hypogaea TaxID=3818 RepID=A0A445DT13_ARAHY|nr:hypothetical protein Ahy_A03g012311 isoform B [Arachis hypogaea]